jgi:hypothetical protein
MVDVDDVVVVVVDANAAWAKVGFEVVAAMVVVGVGIEVKVGADLAVVGVEVDARRWGVAPYIFPNRFSTWGPPHFI